MTPETVAAETRRLCDVGPGSEVSPVHFLEHVDIESLLGDHLLQPRVFLLELSEPFRVVGLHAAVLALPAMPGSLGNLEVLAHLFDRESLVGAD